ncbi:hypothetical protein [Vreelandella salicampi]|uniref:Uncharacterized protein n=1 Tax=Vreelandella salicampi TaxID=1449798 RepID=A0A7Z0LJB3_9GAMM|nr:hypothetical protein [Halomonas salicampi]NYS60041.1 hypothetical protein [Halomonas salicampi]
MNTPNDPETPSASGDMETDYVVGQDNIEGQLGPIGFDIHNRVFMISALMFFITSSDSGSLVIDTQP